MDWALAFPLRSKCATTLQTQAHIAVRRNNLLPLNRKLGSTRRTNSDVRDYIVTQLLPRACRRHRTMFGWSSKTHLSQVLSLLGDLVGLAVRCVVVIERDLSLGRRQQYHLQLHLQNIKANTREETRETSTATHDITHEWREGGQTRRSDEVAPEQRSLEGTGYNDTAEYFFQPGCCV